YPQKTFNVAKVLFQTKDFFHYDMARFVLDESHKTALISLRNGFGGVDYANALHEEDRINACDDSQRKNYHEHLAFSYQVFRGEGVAEEDVKQRQQALWNIFDKYYSELPDEAQGIEILFNPYIDPKLKEYSEEAIRQSSEHMKYMELKLWANYKIDKDERYKSYVKYDDKPQVVLQETKEIIIKLNDGGDESFYLFNANIPANVCSILLLEYFDQLSTEEREYCKDVVIEYSQLPLKEGYHYQIQDGTASAISALPVVFHHYQMERVTVKIILLLTLFNDHS
ncbi:ATP-binding protein, partial [Escherichia coli]|nr:ATP-binding protein [Escherichia coli]